MLYVPVDIFQAEYQTGFYNSTCCFLVCNFSLFLARRGSVQQPGDGETLPRGGVESQYDRLYPERILDSIRYFVKVFLVREPNPT
ncbi:MAG: hypothetical protein D3924_14610 [Candidatus Electrothrix sp. AR4]|nr:hypothetical protein [Candidatus Electrothrix sp. AR4]